MVVCKRLGRSRSAYYKERIHKSEEVVRHQLLSSMVRDCRYLMPRLGGRKLYHLLKYEMEEHQIKMGRDLFFKWLGTQGLLVSPKKSYVRTTNSKHRFRRYSNLVQNVQVERPDQVWVSDITYLRLRKGFCYLALITDAFSRKIIGWDVSDSLELKGSLRALEMASMNRLRSDTIHHSDRGIQYCSNLYVSTLKEKNIKISMAEAGNCYENAMAERVNGILKNEFNMDATFIDTKAARKQAKQAIEVYNNLRPHIAINFCKPAELYAA